MSNSASFPTTPATPATIGFSAPDPAVAVGRARRQFRVRARFWLLLVVALLVSLALSPSPWHAAVRAFLVWEAGRQGCDLTIDAVEGGPFDTIHLYGIYCLGRGSPPEPRAGNQRDVGTDLHVAHAEITFAWTLPWVERPAPSWVQRLSLDGVRGVWDLSSTHHRSHAASAVRPAPLDALASRLIPTNFVLHADDATLRRGRYILRAHGMYLSGNRDDEGLFRARAVEVRGPGFDATLPDQRGRTVWQGNRLTLSNLDLGHGVQLARATLDGTRLARGRLDWDCDLRALGGTVRGQGAVNFSRERLALEVGGSLHAMALGPLARLLEITGPADGRVEQASFSFRGDPENWPAAQMWLAGRATDFRWGQRRWESLEMQAVVTDRRVQVHRLELRQSRNRLSIDGECSLPPDPQNAVEAGRWWHAGFACNVDARLDDLHDLAELFGPPVPDLAGRMSINGRFSARPGTQGLEGYLNVEGSRLSIRGAPLDFLRSTLIFRGEELEVADLQATRGGDYLTGHGSLRIAGATDFQALGRLSVENLDVYAPAYAGLLPWTEITDAAPIRSLTAGLRLEGSILHVDQCHGEQAGNAFEIGGTVDVRDAGNPLLDLSLTGEEAARLADPADVDATWRAGISYALNLRGTLTDGPTLAGDVQLQHGHFDRPGELGANAATPMPLGARLLQPLLSRLPAAWRDLPLDLHLTAADPLRCGETDRVGRVAPNLDITGTGRHPMLGGKVEFQIREGSNEESGAWYFSPGEPENPTMSITAGTVGGQRGAFFYGPLAGKRTVSWDFEPAGGELTLQLAGMPLQPVVSKEMDATWSLTLPVASALFPFGL